ncbi:hypothetical protein FNV43_RR04618 [Rhamnella rubrinervis]|uniref:Seipin n=1 Tax=Rhamnella rubrinervis TaxID=2594499 RepID=A0A8K0HJV8_9ROSA|nr:hypothetical protein FNV43_RR04618 [Rhamnella rubrinervis]
MKLTKPQVNHHHHHHRPPPLPHRHELMEVDDEEAYYLIPKPTDWFTDILSLQADLIYSCVVFLCSPIFSLFSMVSESYHRAEEVANTVESTVQKVPSSIIHGCFLLLKKLGFGFLGAAYVCMVLIAVFIMAVAVGVALVQLWVEEPVSVRERLYFDYTHPHPDALFSFGVIGEGQSSKRIRQMGIPVGQTISVSLALLMPESGFNRDIGVFQLSAEIISVNGDVISKSSHPCILRYRSPPVRLARTALISIPLLLGITDETQRITIQILKHKEGFPRTSAIRVILIPRAGTSVVKEMETEQKQEKGNLFASANGPETVGSSASTISISREETSTAGAEEDFGDSESVCLGG